MFRKLVLSVLLGLGLLAPLSAAEFSSWEFPEFNVSAGNIPGVLAVSKYGRAPSGVQTTTTDIWDRANATPTQSVWLAPTAARIHTLASTDVDDDITPSQDTGAGTVRVYGLASWTTAEVSEDVDLNGTTGVAMTTAMVCIHRIKVIAAGSTGSNEGIISATAATDSTVTAAILVGIGQTQMAIYCIPSIQNAYVSGFYANVLRGAGAAVGLDLRILVNEAPNTNPVLFLVKHTTGLINTGASNFQHKYNPFYKVAGPAIIKLNALGTAADMDASAGFGVYLSTK